MRPTKTTVSWQRIKSGELITDSQTGGLTFQVPQLGRVWVSLNDAHQAEELSNETKFLLLLMQDGTEAVRIWAARLLRPKSLISPVPL